MRINKKTFDMTTLAGRMAYITKLIGTQKELAVCSGVALRTITSLAGGKTNNRVETYNLLAKAADVDPDWLMTGKGDPAGIATPYFDIAMRQREAAPGMEAFEDDFSKGIRLASTKQGLPFLSTLGTVPVIGSAAGALAGSMTLSNEPIEWVRRPDGLSHVPDAYALYVVGSSMVTRYLPGDVIFVHPHKPCRINDVVVIQMQNGEGREVTSYLKIYGQIEGDELIVSQFSDQTKIRFKLAYIKAIHRVMTNNELYQL
jgi:transcriptional regulator with XRE-family HTH domain